MKKTSHEVLADEVRQNYQSHLSFSKRNARKIRSVGPEDIVQLVFTDFASKIDPPNFYFQEEDAMRWSFVANDRYPLFQQVRTHIRWMWGTMYKREVTRRKSHFSATEEFLAGIPSNDSGQTNYKSFEYAAHVGDCLEKLPEDLRAVFVKKNLERKTFGAIEEEMRLPRGQATQMNSQAKVKLADCIQSKTNQATGMQSKG